MGKNVLRKISILRKKRCKETKGKERVEAREVCERGIWEFSLLEKHTEYNNSPDAPPRSLVTRAVRAFYSARDHSR